MYRYETSTTTNVDNKGNVDVRVPSDNLKEINYKQMKQGLLMLTIGLMSASMTFGQSAQPVKLSLKDRVKQAVEKNVNVRTAQLDKEKCLS